jgi:vacuolar-type H+-ATPase subunit H
MVYASFGLTGFLESLSLFWLVKTVMKHTNIYDRSQRQAAQSGLKGERMQGFELVKNLAELDRQLSEKLEEARRSAADRIKSAEEERTRLLAEAEAQIRQMHEESRARIVEQSSQLAEEARTRAQAEKERLRQQAGPNLDRAVELILSKVLP